MTSIAPAVACIRRNQGGDLNANFTMNFYYYGFWMTSKNLPSIGHNTFVRVYASWQIHTSLSSLLENRISPWC